jgi:FKBP-type peptidyl-prolyl cis-trans isomerase SlyD
VALLFFHKGGKMNRKNISNIIVDDVVVTMDYTLIVEGKQIGSSKKSGPISFVQGQQSIVPGLEKNLYEMKIGDTKEIRVSALDGYGEIDPEDFLILQKSEFSENIPMEPGTIINLRDEDGDIQKARIDSINEDEVTLNFNHPLAGKELTFQVTILDLHAATQDEIESGLTQK